MMLSKDKETGRMTVDQAVDVVALSGVGLGVIQSVLMHWNAFGALMCLNNPQRPGS
jgi:hypothetical protein